MGRHVERVRCVGRQVRIFPRVGQTARRQRRRVVAVNEVVRHPGMIGLERVELFENRRGLQLVGVGLVGWQRRLIDRQRVEGCSFEVFRVLGVDLLHRLFIGERPRAMIECVGVLIEKHGRRDVLALPIGFRANRLRRFRSCETILQCFRGPQAGKRVAPRAQGDSPLRDAARWIALQHVLEPGGRVGKLEGVEQCHRVIEFLTD